MPLPLYAFMISQRVGSCSDHTFDRKGHLYSLIVHSRYNIRGRTRYPS